MLALAPLKKLVLIELNRSCPAVSLVTEVITNKLCNHVGLCNNMGIFKICSLTISESYSVHFDI